MHLVVQPSGSSSGSPSSSPSGSSSGSPTSAPTSAPTSSPTSTPTSTPTGSPTRSPTGSPTAFPTVSPISICDQSIVDLGEISCSNADLTVTGNTATSCSQYGNQAPEDIFAFTVGVGAETLTFSSCGSTYDTYLRVYDKDWIQVAEKDDNDNFGDECFYQAILVADLGPGTYFLVVEGYEETNEFSCSGEYSVAISAECSF